MLLSLFFACISDAPTYHEHVQPIIEGRCTSCHYEGGISGISFEEYETTAEWSKAIANAVSRKTMPPWPADSGVSYTNDWSLSEDEIQTILEWDEAGARKGASDASVAPLASVGRPLSRVDLSLSMPEPY
ncbi:MAG: cytochrome c, partial [Pseudomonadota bacterium]|nr:cytochrome c [Pseudomonadota bacterium]